MFVFIPICCLILAIITGCQPNKKTLPVRQTGTVIVPKDTTAVSLFEAEHADLFFPFSYQLQSLHLQEQKEGVVCTLSLKVKEPIEETIAAYEQHMHLYGWRKVLSVATQLLFEKPYARCVITFVPQKQGITEIMLVFATLGVDEQYQQS